MNLIFVNDLSLDPLKVAIIQETWKAKKDISASTYNGNEYNSLLE